MRTLAFALIALSALAAAAPVDSTAKSKQSVDPHANETPAQRDARMHWWRQARFGMFIHWGLYAQLAGTWQGKQTGGAGEWIMHDFKIPVADYAAVAPQFNPVQFNADQWVSIAKAAGMKYIVMTAKHHEGFAMFHSLTDPYNIFDATPFKRDPIAEMAAACKKQGLKFGVYYSQAQDWHHAGGAAYGGHWDPAQDGDLHAYVKNIAAPQVRELITRYRPAVLWWDTEVKMSPEDIQELTASFALEPELIANNRLGNGVPGDTETPEQRIPANGYPGKDWETCMTINDTWGYKSFDNDFKSGPQLIRNLVDIASKGGNYLLNVGPEPTGLIPEPEVDRLQEMGAWLKKNGQSIYATTAGPYKKLPFAGRITVKGATMYLNIFEWPEQGLSLPGLQTNVKGARVLATGERLNVKKSYDGKSWVIDKPTQLDPVSTAIALNLSGPPTVTEPEYFVEPRADGSIHMQASDAILEGNEIKAQGDASDANIGYWTNAKDAVDWKVDVKTGGTYGVEIQYSCEPGSEGSTIAIEVDRTPAISGLSITATQSWKDFHSFFISQNVTLTPGHHVIRVVPLTKPGLAVMNLKSLTLTPTGSVEKLMLVKD